MEFISHSGAKAGTPNAHQLVIGGHRILLDCGAGGAGSGYLDSLPRPDAVWISHAHGDHCGALLELLGRWPRLKVLAAAGGSPLIAWSLGKEGVLERRILPVPWQRFREIPGCPGLRMMALPAGHVPGAAMVVLEVEEQGQPRRVLYTGDFCTHDQAVVRGAGVPARQGGFPIDAVISEAMLANEREADQVEWSQEAAALVEDLRGDGPSLVGVASLGESAEVCAILAAAGIEPMIDASLRAVLELCPGLPDEVLAMSFGDWRRMRGRLRGGGVVIARGDQWRSRSAVHRLAAELLSDREATVVVLNRARQSTPAGRLVAAGRGESLKWSGRTVELAAGVAHRRLINHAPRWALMAMLQAVGAPVNLLVHGPTGARWALKRALEKEGFSGSIEVVERRRSYPIGSPEST